MKIATGLSLPPEAVTETFGLLAARGAGKTNTARVIAEEMFAAGLRFVAIDPVGSWPGLRSSRDGKKSGIPIPIFGGKHGDVPLERTGGKLVASLIVEQHLSAVVDVSTFESEAARKQFLLDFATELYRLNEEPLHLFLEEADDYIPQKPMRDEARLVRAWSNIVRRGRARGLGITLITQRSAVVAKDVLTQVQTLIAMRTTSPQDRKAVEAWVQYNDQSRDILESLSSLEDGEAWIWSPQFLKVTKRVRFRLSKTFDSGATPTVGKRRRQRTIADVDVTAIRGLMSATIEKAEAEDPKLLRRKLAELEKQNRALRHPYPTPEPVIERVEVPILTDEARREIIDLKRSILHIGNRMTELTDKIGAAPNAPRVLPKPARARSSNGKPEGAGTVLAKAPPGSRTASRVLPSGPVDRGMKKAERKILTALAQHGTLSLTQAAMIAGYRPTSGGVRNAASALRTIGYVEGSNASLDVTESGLGALGPVEELPTGAALADRWYGQLKKAEREILKAVIDAYPGTVSLAEAAEIVGYRPTSGGVRNAASKLRTLALILGGNTAMRAAQRLIS